MKLNLTINDAMMKFIVDRFALWKERELLARMKQPGVTPDAVVVYRKSLEKLTLDDYVRLILTDWAVGCRAPELEQAARQEFDREVLALKSDLTAKPSTGVRSR